MFELLGCTIRIEYIYGMVYHAGAHNLEVSPSYKGCVARNPLVQQWGLPA